MTSYKNVVKFNYTQNPTDVVSLREYILFEDGEDGKYALLKFINNLDQKLYALQFEAHQYDSDGNLIAKSVVMYDEFTAEAGETFVPKAKLKISVSCESISVKLLSAHFDRVKWENGEFSDNSYTFKRYVADEQPVAAKTKAKGRQADDKSVSAPAKQKTPKKGKNKPVDFRSKDVTRENFAKFPRIFAIIVFILVIAFVISTSVYVKLTSKEFSIGDFDVVKYSDNSLTIVGYCGTDKNVVIPAELDGCTVVKIGNGAFRYSNIRSVQIDASQSQITVSSNAFYKCNSLKLVSSSGANNVQVLGYAFNGCKNINTITMPNAVVSDYGFNGSFNVKSYSFIYDNQDLIFGEQENK